MKEPKFSQDWKVLYTAATLESDCTQLWHRIEAADAAMQARLNKLRQTPSIHSEQLELQSSLGYLRCLKKILTTELC
jgi:hypothetical protein